MHSFDASILRRAARPLRRLHLLALGALTTWFLLACSAAIAQPAGWTYTTPITVTENSGATLTGYQLRLTIDTASLIAAGRLNADGSDLLFGADAAGTTLLPYYLDSGINTATTVVWVKLGTLPASSSIGIFLFTGNPGATSASTLSVFDYTDQLNNSATNQVNSGGAGGVGNSQRGFRFSPNQDILVTDFGKDEPTGTTRYVTLFDFSTQAIIAQTQVPGPAAVYSYTALAQPVWLTAGTQYVLELYQDTADGYYFGTSSQINPLLTYFDMRYCNSCTQNTFPTNTLTNYQYGYPDFQFRTHQQVSPAPSFVLGAGSTTTTLTSSGSPTVFGESVTFTATVSGVFNPGGTMDFFDGMAALGGCSGVAVAAGVAGCTTTALGVGVHNLTASYSGDANNAPSTSPVLQQTVNQAATTTTVSAPGPITLGQSTTVTANVSVTSPGAGAPSGTVTVSDGSASCTITLPATTCSLTPTSTGTKTVAATYAGDTNFSGSSGSTSLTVNAAATGTTLASSAPAAVFGQSVTFTATIGGNAPTGTVTFNDGANPLTGCTNPATLAGTTATCATNTLGVGAHSITAAYSGDANNTASTSAPLAQTVGQAATSTTVGALAPITLGQSVTVNVTVAVVAPGAGTPTGTVSVVDGSASCTITLPATSCMLTPTASGTQTVTATYNGDANFSGSSGGTSLTVNGVTPPTVAATPALGRWSMLLLMVLLAAAGAMRQRAKRG